MHLKPINCFILILLTILLLRNNHLNGWHPQNHEYATLLKEIFDNLDMLDSGVITKLCSYH